jgi:hypothetical protein
LNFARAAVGDVEVGRIEGRVRISTAREINRRRDAEPATFMNTGPDSMTRFELPFNLMELML